MSNYSISELVPNCLLYRYHKYSNVKLEEWILIKKKKIPPAEQPGGSEQVSITSISQAGYARIFFKSPSGVPMGVRL